MREEEGAMTSNRNKCREVGENERDLSLSARLKKMIRLRLNAKYNSCDSRVAEFRTN